MRKSLFAVVLAAAVAALLGVHPATRAAEGPYRFIKEIPIGGDGGWDYAAVDVTNRRLYISHAAKVVVIDIDKDQAVGEIAPTPGVHGIAFAPELGLGFVTCGSESKAAIFDLKTLQITSKVDAGGMPDAVLYEPVRQEVYTFNHRTNDSTVFEARTGKIVATIKLSGVPEFAQVDSQAGRIYNNIEDKNEVAVIDTRTHTVVASWPIAPAEGATGMALDLAHHRLFLGANVLTMMDSTKGKVLATVPVGPGVDAAAYDPTLDYAFASAGGDGTVTVAQPKSATELAVVQVLKTRPGSRTMTLDPKTHKLYLAAADYEAPAAAQGAPARRQMVAGSFKVLVYGLTQPPKGTSGPEIF
jgi:DNA-binding beta-propeller fold protein YncE